MTFLRFGTFHKIEDGKITATYVYLGLAELIIALGLWTVSVSQSGGLGTYFTIDAFIEFQRPFEKTFVGLVDGKDDGITGVSADCKAGDD